MYEEPYAVAKLIKKSFHYFEFISEYDNNNFDTIHRSRKVKWSLLYISNTISKLPMVEKLRLFPNTGEN